MRCVRLLLSSKHARATLLNSFVPTWWQQLGMFAHCTFHRVKQKESHANLGTQMAHAPSPHGVDANLDLMLNYKSSWWMCQT